MKPTIFREICSIPGDILRSLKRFRTAMDVPGWRNLFLFCVVLTGVLMGGIMLAMGYDRAGPSFMQFRICNSMSVGETLIITLVGVMVPLFALIAIGEIISVVDDHQRYGKANAREKRWMVGSVSILIVLCLTGTGLLYAWC